MNKTKNKDGLPKYCHARGNMIWVRLQDETGKWNFKSSGYTLDQVEQARIYVDTLVRGFAARRAENDVGKFTVRKYALRWVTDREKRGIQQASTDRARLEKYILPEVGDVELADFRPRHARDLVRALRSRTGDDEIAPRTVLHIYQVLHSLFESAVVDEYVLSNPVKTKPGELPKKVDLDPEWRGQATYTTAEIEMLISDPRLPRERRVMYGLKALAGMRHGEAAALRVRNIDFDAVPLKKITVAHSFQSPTGNVKSTKTQETRTIPMHPVLDRLVTEWLNIHWPNVYGRKPTADDFIVPTRTMRPVSVKDALEALHRDLVLLGLRLDAGEIRKRGGHDMRSFYDTQSVDDGADSMLIHRTTHAPPKTVAGGYQRFAYSSLCREVAKLNVKLPAGVALPIVAASLRASNRVNSRWLAVTPLGLESSKNSKRIVHMKGGLDGDVPLAFISEPSSAQPTTTASYQSYDSLVSVEKALKRGDLDLAKAIVQRMRERAE